MTFNHEEMRRAIKERHPLFPAGTIECILDTIEKTLGVYDENQPYDTDCECWRYQMGQGWHYKECTNHPKSSKVGKECTCNDDPEIIEEMGHKIGCPLYQEVKCTCDWSVLPEGSPHKNYCPLYKKEKKCTCIPGIKHRIGHENSCPLFVAYSHRPKKEEVLLPELLDMPNPKSTKHRELYKRVNQLIRYLKAKDNSSDAPLTTGLASTDNGDEWENGSLTFDDIRNTLGECDVSNVKITPDSLTISFAPSNATGKALKELRAKVHRTTDRS